VAAVLTLLNVACLSAPHPKFLDELVATVFDPSWNLEHRAIIWGVIITVLLLSGMGLPLPEDIPLTLAGFTTMKQAGDSFVLANFVATFLVVVAPILLGDIVAYSLGRKYGLGLRERVHLLRRLITKPRLARVHRWFERYGAFTVFLGRQVAGVRFVTFFTAGSVRVPLPRFIFFDFLGSLISVPVWLSLGAFTSLYGEQWLRPAMRRAGSGFFLGAVLIFIVFLIVIKLRRGRTAHIIKAPGSAECRREASEAGGQQSAGSRDPAARKAGTAS
jgi:membrane protein DedA with SNARE-associated domain